MTTIGEVYAYRLSVWAPAGDRDLGAFGAARILARCDSGWLAGALDTFAPEVDQVLVSAPLLTMASVPELPARQGMFLFRGPEVPDDWHRLGQTELSPDETEVARLYMCWKDPGRSGFETAVAYKKLGGVAENLGSLSSSVAIEWRCRFERSEFLSELNLDAPAVKKPPRTWDDVSTKEIHSGYPASLRTALTLAYQELLNAVREEPLTPDVLEAALVGFFEAAAQDESSSEYRDEIAALALDVALMRGGSEKSTYALAERSLS